MTKKYAIIPSDVRIGSVVKLNPFLNREEEIWNPFTEKWGNNRLGVKNTPRTYWHFVGEKEVKDIEKNVWIHLKGLGYKSFPRQFLLVKGVDYDD